jgi:hypothetical protein
VSAGGLESASTTQCLTVASPFAGAPVTQAACSPGATTGLTQIWLPGPGGELINAASGKCLDDPGDGPSGTALTQEDCYGQLGELWAFN